VKTAGEAARRPASALASRRARAVEAGAAMRRPAGGPTRPRRRSRRPCSRRRGSGPGRARCKHPPSPTRRQGRGAQARSSSRASGMSCTTRRKRPEATRASTVAATTATPPTLRLLVCTDHAGQVDAAGWQRFWDARSTEVGHRRRPARQRKPHARGTAGDRPRRDGGCRRRPSGRLQPSVRYSSASLATASASRSPLEPLPACSMAWFSSWSTRGPAVFRYGATRVSASADRA
jgi:hypothetical protein